MQVTADLHLHSKYSRAVSPQMILPTMAQVALDKGLQLLTASDWTHPVWFKEISALLAQTGEGVYRLNVGTEAMQSIKFILSTEISCIYKQGEKLRRIHNLVFVSSLEKAEKLSKALVVKGCNLTADGRPIIGLTSRQLLELLLEIDPAGFFIPAHVWTPHFGIYGSASGFDSLEEAFGDLAPYIYGIETGLSSDPEMNWQIPELASRSILSFSDAHSPQKMGREATMLELEDVDFPHLKLAVQKGKSQTNKIVYTIEFYPEEGKYHYSGHRTCKVRLSPDELQEKGDLCPTCKRKLTEGVFSRLAYLSGKKEFSPAITRPNADNLHWLTNAQRQHPPYVKLVPLLEIVAEALDSTVASQKVKLTYNKAIKMLGTEHDILLKSSEQEIAHAVGEKVAQAIGKVRSGEIAIEPGYDGEYGKVKIWGDSQTDTEDASADSPQMSLDF
ncbi:MAG TPA: endonuclease Q family protein [Patescibacteria group bacterium]|nr:endonuclease Q family protein [Patescibacteria group bacterium]